VGVVVAALVMATAATVAGVQASTSGAHFMRGTTDSLAGNGALVVNIDEAGVGTENVTYTLTTDATATYACINGGGNHPKAANKETFASALTGGGTFSPTNGRISASLSVGPIGPGNFSCPGGQTMVLAGVSYSNVVLRDTTNGVSTTLPSRSATYFNV
jgi:long-subunit fatty acid transport protein